MPVTNVSRLTAQAVSEALSLGQEVIAVTVEFIEVRPTAKSGRGQGGAQDVSVDSEGATKELQRQWRRWHPQVPLHVLRTEYASVVRPIVDYVEQLRAKRSEQIVVLIPVILPERPWHWLLHNHLDRALSAELRMHPDVVVARVSLSLRDAAQ